MTIAATSFTATASSSSASGAQQTESPKITSDFQTFLRMLTVQMQNQDPLNPIDSADYAVQLATFSGVEQQVRTNQLLADMQASFQQSGMAEMANWIGKEVRSDAPVRYDRTPVSLSLTPAAGATSAVLVVRDTQGKLVSREEVPATAGPYSWLGAGADGAPLPPGYYALFLESRADDAVIATKPLEHYARVVEARSTAEGTKLVLEGGVEVAASRVTALREPQG
jgi:flagellar basal-body rod modification protein FlgD